MSTNQTFTQAELEMMFPQFQTNLKRVGRIGATYEATDTEGNVFLLKVLLPENAEIPSVFLQLFNEVKALKLLDHKGFFKLHSSGDAMGVPYMCTEYFDGTSLHEMYLNQRVPERDAIYIVAKVCASLKHMHDRGMVHFGIKPSNIWLNDQGQIKLLQLGQVRFSEGSNEYPPVLATAGYIAPEMTSEDVEITSAADIYACGALLSQLITGMTPDQYTQKPSQIAGCSITIDKVIASACHEDPSLRIQDIGLMGEVLSVLATGEVVDSSLLESLCFNNQAELINQVDSNLPTRENFESEGVLLQEAANEVSPTLIEQSFPKAKKSSNGAKIGLVLALLLLAAGTIWSFMHRSEKLNDVVGSDIQGEREIPERNDDNEPNDESDAAPVTIAPAYFYGYGVNKEYVAKRVKMHKHKGVEFVLMLPENVKKPKGVVVFNPYQRGTFLKEYPRYLEVHDAYLRGYAILSWCSPARKHMEDSHYGRNTAELTENEANARKNKWAKWLPIIDEGITFLTNKFQLPTSGYVVRADCLGVCRTSRYVTAYPERFSALVYSKPHSLDIPRVSGSSIFTYLTANSGSYHSTRSSLYFQQLAALGSPAVLRFTDKIMSHNVDTGPQQIMEYILSVREEMKIDETSSVQDIERLMNRYKTDLKTSKYVYDYVNHEVLTREAADWVPEEQKIGIPNQAMSSTWRKGQVAMRTDTSETFNTNKVGDYKSLQMTMGTMVTAKKPMKIVRSGHWGVCVNLPSHESVLVKLKKGVDEDSQLRLRMKSPGSKGQLRAAVLINGKWHDIPQIDLKDKERSWRQLVINLPAGTQEIKIWHSLQKNISIDNLYLTV